MIRFELMPVVFQNLTGFWALLVCLASLACLMMLLRQRRYPACTVPAVCFAIAYVILHICREGTELRLHGRITEIARQALSLPWAVFPALLLLLSAAVALQCRNAWSWSETHISAASIKESLDSLPAGVCYYLKDGRCILVNERMQEICFSLLGRTLQDGTVFYAFVQEKPVHALSNGTAVSFRHRELIYEGAPLHELIADDITELYEKTLQLRAGNERARRLNAAMKAYGEDISGNVRRREILQAKAAIHDGMNRMILATRAAAREGAGAEERREILRMWRGQALLLSGEAEQHHGSNVVSDLNSLASVIGVRIEWEGAPRTEEAPVLSLFLSAAREAMINAAKHARASVLRIRVEEDGSSLRAFFTNDGEPPALPVQETGGLLELRRRIGEHGGSMEVYAEEIFRLSVTIPKEGRDDAV